MAEKSNPGTRQTDDKDWVFINAYLYLPFFLLKRLEVSTLYMYCTYVCISECLAVGGSGMHGIRIQKKNLMVISPLYGNTVGPTPSSPCIDRLHLLPLRGERHRER
jgi:hypothetical protein